MTSTKTQLQSFHDKFQGKKIKHCRILGNTLNFGYDSLGICCSSTLPHAPVLCNTDLVKRGSFHKDDFIQYLLEIMYGNQCDGICTGCEALEEFVFEGFDYGSMQVNHIIWNNFRGCNSRCVYCTENNSKILESYTAYKIAEDLYQEGFLAENTKIDFGGGEPTMLPNLKDYLQFGYDHHWRQTINTSGILFSQDIYDGLSQGVSVQISPDAGTRQTYQKVKRCDCFDRVWNHIGRYCDYPDQVSVKYIVFSWNSSQEDLDGFVAQCKKHGVKRVVVSGEGSAIFGSAADGYTWEFGEREEAACAYLIQECLNNGLAVYFSSGNFSKTIQKRVLQKLSDFLKDSQTENKSGLYIFGMGSNGKMLCDALMEANIPMNGFLDNAPEKWEQSYHGLACQRLAGMPRGSRGIPKDSSILISNENFRPVLEQLKQEGFQRIHIFHV